MQLRRSPSARVLDRDWHETRQRAREIAFDSDLSEFSDSEITKYNLGTARIDGSDNKQTFTWDRPLDLFSINGTDVRGLDDR